MYPGTTWRKDPAQKKIYLTFDDGPVHEATPFVLDVLKEHDVKATFFCVGENISKNPGLFQRILDEGHRVGNHTYNHLKGWDTDTKAYFRNIRQCADLVDSNLFRPPYGKAKKSQLNILKDHYSIIMWDVLSGDYDKNTSPEQCLANTITNVRNGSIIVFHDSAKARRNMEYALPRFISFAREMGYTFERL
jgi:peptidoglycan/xylan/chitin deacetylase (PgdA/CDA1 family)